MYIIIIIIITYIIIVIIIIAIIIIIIIIVIIIYLNLVSLFLYSEANLRIEITSIQTASEGLYCTYFER